MGHTDRLLAIVLELQAHRGGAHVLQRDAGAACRE